LFLLLKTVDASLNSADELGVCTLSAATDSDFEFLYDLKKRAYKEYVEQTWGWDDAFQLKFHKDNFSTGNTKIIKAGDTPIGSVDVKEAKTNIFISGLCLLPDYQSKGIGSKIIKDLIMAAEEKKKRLELEVLKVNSRARSLYERLGFRLEDRDKNKYFMYR
jgi:ribosomal protein S18 acetylase RimI-like enzyme